MNHDFYIERLGGLMEGGLPAPEREAVLDHLDDCDTCRAEVEWMAALRADARKLSRGLAPSRDLWAGIAARIGEQGGRAAVIELADRRAPQPPHFSGWLRLAAAAMVIVALSSGLTAHLMRSRDLTSATVASLDPASAGSPNLAFAAFQSTEREYIGAVEVLEAQLEARRGSLAPETIRVIEANLAIIDDAIAESRAALQADPASTDLPLHLSNVYGSKIALLEAAVQLAVRT